MLNDDSHSLAGTREREDLQNFKGLFLAYAILDDDFFERPFLKDLSQRLSYLH